MTSGSYRTKGNVDAGDCATFVATFYHKMLVVIK
jgi:hypothetical protein